MSSREVWCNHQNRRIRLSIEIAFLRRDPSLHVLKYLNIQDDTTLEFSLSAVQSKNMRIALFGGAFDPPHLGHQQVARSLIEQHIVDEVWFVPVKKHPFDKQLTEDTHRLAMLNLVVDKNHNQKIERFELDRSQKSFSFLTLEHFQNTFVDYRFSWVIGADNVEHFSEWYKAEELLQKFTVYVYPRVGTNHVWSLPSGMVFLDQMQPINISSTQIKQKVKAGESITDLVDSSVERYIREKELYKNS